MKKRRSGHDRALRALGPLLVLLLFQIPISAGAADLGTGRLIVTGTRVTVSPEAQTVPYRTATVVQTTLEGFDAAQGTMPPDLRVVGDFTGPEIDGVLRLETTPGEPFRIPRLSVEGQYQLDDIRLVQGDELLTYAEPRSAGVLVTQVLVSRVTSRALTLDEIRSYGLVIDNDRYHAFNFTFGFAVDGEVFDYNVPVIASPSGDGGVTLQVLEGADPLGGGARRGTTAARFRPPQLAPFTLELERSGGSRQPTGGCLAIEGCAQGAPVSLPGVILFPTDVSLLNQFFSVVVIAKNDAPAGDALVIRDLTAKVSLPPGLRLAETEPPTPLGVPVPVRVPGADGELGTGDDITFLVAQAEGQAEVVVEGRKQGTHVVEFDLHGVLDGFPDGEIRKVTGRAKGAVVVRDPTLGLTISHPDTVRTDEEYSLFLTVSNTGNAPVNLLGFTLPTGQLSGVQVVGSNTRSIPALAPGESDVVEFRLRSLRTGRVVASTIKAGSQVSPSFELAVGVGETGIPLSPDAIVLPKSSEELPGALSREALGMIGLGYSLATAPASSLRPGLPWVDLDALHEKVYWLSQAGRHVDLGEELFDSVAVLAAEWTGARDADREWDLLRRTTARGAGFGTEVGEILAAEAAATTHGLAFERFAATTAFLGPIEAALATGDGVTLTVASRTSGATLSGTGIDPLRSRALAFADLYDLGGARMALLAAPEAGGHRVQVRSPNGSPASLRILVPEADGTLRTVTWSGVSLSAAGSATVDYLATDTAFTLAVDADGDGLAEIALPGTLGTVAPRPFAVVGAAQDPVVVTGHTIDVLFTQDVDLRSLLDRDPSHFVLPGKVSNGGLVQAEADVGSFFELVAENPFEGLMNTRVVRVSFDRGLSPYRNHDLAVNGIESVGGDLVTGDVVTVETRVTDPGTIVQGTVYGPDGEPVPFAKVELLETDFFYFKLISDPCETHRTALVEADSQGRFEFDYVRQTQCGDLFEIRGFDPLSGHHGTAQGRVRFVGQTIQLDVLMLGRGTVRGRVTYEDGTVPDELQVVGYSPVFYQGREAELGPDGTYAIHDLPVGTVSLGASDRIGSFVYQTVEIPRAGAVVERNLTIFRRPSEEPTGDVRGTVLGTDGVTPQVDAYVALYVDGELAGVEHSGFDGTFDFGTVRAGVAEIEAFDGETGQTGAQLFFDIQPDQVNDVTVLLQDERGTVEGHVYRQTLSETTPLAGAVVWVSGTPFHTVTDANGFYRLEGVYAGNRTVLAADLERQVQVSAQVAVRSDGETVYRDLYFVESVGSGLAGELLGLTGNPVAGAIIHLADGHGGWWKEATTDLEGRFRIPDLTPGSYEIHAIKGALGAVATATIRFEGETPFVQIRFQRGTVRGSTRVIGESGQLTGVTSLVTYRTTVPNDHGLVELDLEAHTLETAADGSFEIPDVLAGRYQLTVSNAFHGEQTVRDRIVYEGEVRDHDFVFHESGTVRGTVLDWDGETPVPGATVHLRHPAFSAYDLTTDAEGRFTFELVPPRSRRFAVDAEIEKDGIFRTARVWVGLTRAGQDLDAEIVLPMQGTVSGWVEDSAGTPVPGAVVTLREGSYPNRRLIHNADTDGNFVFNNVFVGDVSLSAQAPALGGLGGRDSVVLVEEQQEVFSLIVLEATGEIEGTIFSPESGEEVSTAQVTLQRWPSGRTFDTVTASEGTYRFRLLPLDLYRVRVFDPSTGRFGQSDWVTVDADGHVSTVDVTLQARGDVDGHLYEPESGLGVPGATIKLYSSSLRPFTTYSSTDVDGYFEFLGIPEGSFTLNTQEPDGRRLASGAGEIVEEDERVTVDLHLEEFGRVVGSVLNPPGLPDGLFANANVVLYENGRAIGATLDNPFTFDGVLSGRSLEVRAFENGGDHRAKVKGKLPAGESEIALDLRMVARGSAAVTVVDSGGAPVAGAAVSLRNDGYYGYRSLQANTGPDGQAVFQDLGAGWITASASHPTSVLKGSARGDLALDGEQVELVVTLEPSGTVRGRALLSDGVTPATEGLAVVTRGSRTLQHLVDENGDFEFTGVPLGSFSAFVQESFGPGTILRTGSLSIDGEVIDLGTLVLDDHDPAVATITPTTGTADLPLSTVVTVRFSEPVDTSKWSGSWITFRKAAGSNIAYTSSWSEGDTALTLTPNNPLASFTAYDVIVKDAHDLAGRRLSVQGRTTFNTVDVVPPAVVDFLPREGENQIPLDASILVTFSEEVTLASLSGSSLQLVDVGTGAGVTTTFQHLEGGRQVLVTPASGLEADRQYRLTVQNVSDGGGNAMAAPVSVSFWSVDLEPPEITSVDFPEGTSYVAGDEVPVQVTAVDEWGVASTALAIDGWTWSDESEPWELTGVVPITAAAGQVTVEIFATDVHGNTASVLRSLDVAPNPNAVAPAPAAACGREGGYVVPGYAVELGAVATDDETVESIALFVDGVEVGRASPLASSPAAAGFLWTPPAGAAPGTTFTARLEARDFAGNVGATEIALTTPPASATVLTHGTTLFASTYDGADLVLASGTFLAHEPLGLASLTVARSARMVSEVGANIPLDLTVAGWIDVQCGGAIDGSAGGFPRVTGNGKLGSGPEWTETADYQGGGSHGGVGTAAHSISVSRPGEIYGSVFEPALGGAGGANEHQGDGNWGGAGGGPVRIEAGSLELDGEIRSRGESQPDSGGSGAGGSVVVRTGSLRGHGRVDASGGDDLGEDPWDADGAGGGGRIAIYADTVDAAFDPVEQLRAWGGARVHTAPEPDEVLAYGAPGTVLLRTLTDDLGHLYVSNGVEADGTVRVGPPTELPALGAGTVTAFEPSGTDAWVTAAEPFRPRWLGAYAVLLDAAGAELGTFRVAELDATGRALLEGAGAIAGAASFRGEWQFDSVETFRGAGLTTEDHVSAASVVLSGPTSLGPELTAADLQLASGAVVTPASGGTIRLGVTGTMTVEAGATLDVTGLGYPGGTSANPTGGTAPGLAGSTHRTGGSHGGSGGQGEAGGIPGEVFDSVYEPRLSGGGAGWQNYGAAPGGGIVELEVGALVLDGSIFARGGDGSGTWDAAGAGGTIALRAGSVSGSGLLDASGGDAVDTCRSAAPGAGGGGRIALQVDDLTGFDLQSRVRAWGGVTPECDAPLHAAPGTIYVRSTGDTYGRLVLDAGQAPDGTDRQSPATELTALGSGSITSFDFAALLQIL